MTAAPPNAMRAATCTASFARSGCPAPRFCPATAAAAPMSPTDVHVMSEKSCEYETANAACAAALCASEPMNDEHEHAADVHRDALNARRQAEPEQRSDDRPVGPESVLSRGNETTHPPRQSFHSA